MDNRFNYDKVMQEMETELAKPKPNKKLILKITRDSQCPYLQRSILNALQCHAK
ncbi:hypothetical protein [Reichenbachiella sp. MALMAid0571]|uniref:hypothetical protein n=1 Tax=Reichenbachiella sp. MALMAid0571 TaxID=3143939 RepID=UPI0032DEDD91